VNRELLHRDNRSLFWLIGWLIINRFIVDSVPAICDTGNQNLQSNDLNVGSGNLSKPDVMVIPPCLCILELGSSSTKNVMAIPPYHFRQWK